MAVFIVPLNRSIIPFSWRYKHNSEKWTEILPSVTERHLDPTDWQQKMVSLWHTKDLFLSPLWRGPSIWRNRGPLRMMRVGRVAADTGRGSCTAPRVGNISLVCSYCLKIQTIIKSAEGGQHTYLEKKVAKTYTLRCFKGIERQVVRHNISLQHQNV